MRAEVKLITPEFAEKLLEMNIGNRKLKNVKNSYIGQMRNGEWKENGEPIIIDTNGIIKDGQHRLHACIEANFSWNCPIIYDVEPDVMDTIDTGTNRSLNDVLALNGFPHTSSLAAMVKAIMIENQDRTSKNNRKDSYEGYLSNNRCLRFALENTENLMRLVRVADVIYKEQPVNVLSRTEIGLYLYILAGSSFNFTTQHRIFIESITGVKPIGASVTNWVNKKLLVSKSTGTSVNKIWKRNSIIKAWNVFSTADHPVTHLRIDISKIEKVNKTENTLID